MIVRRWLTRSLLPACTLSAALARAEVSLPALFADHMVLQRNQRVPIWGQASPGEDVSVAGSWDASAAQRTRADERGRWRVDLPTAEAGGPHTVTISATNRIELRDVLLGEVWLASGQSNMEWKVSQCLNGAFEARQADLPRIRVFDVQNRVALHPTAQLNGRWVVSSPDVAANFSATAFYFARSLHSALNVPVGVITSDWGGTRIEAWMSADALAAFPGPAQELAKLKTLADPERRAELEQERREGWWGRIARFDPGGADGAWTRPDFKDADWKPLAVPAALSGDGLDSFDGLFYYRRSIELPAEWENATASIELGPIDDRDDTYVNGQRVGGEREDGKWNTPRVYEIPAGVLKRGANVICVRVLDTGGIAGINGRPEQLKLQRSGADESLPLAGEWRVKAGRPLRELPPLDSSSVGPNTATALHNAMIAPLMPYRIAGAIWYQGESNRGNALEYRRLLPTMITSWRGTWGQGDFPFGIVQIAPFRYQGDKGESALLREAQSLALQTPNTGIVVTMDIGDPADIHPVNKQDVGGRLALWALANTYGQSSVAWSGPRWSSMEIEGDRASLKFDHAAGGLIARGGPVRHVEVAGSDRKFFPAQVELDGSVMRVRSESVKEPVAVRYAWCNDCETNLFNAAGLPAAPFRTDDWPQ